MKRQPWAWTLLLGYGCGGATPEPPPAAPRETPGCPRVASIHCEGRLDRAGTGSTVINCRAPARSDDQILVLWRGRPGQPFQPAPVERVSPCEVRASLPGAGEETYVALVAASGAVILESRPVHVTALGEMSGPSERPTGERRVATRDPPSRGGEMPLVADGPRQERYAGWVILVDLVSLATIPFGVGIIGAVAGAPVVHGVHGNGAAAGTSALLRVGVPLGVIGASFLAFKSSSDCEQNLEDGCFGEAMGALLLGGVSLVVVMVVDWSVLAKRRVEPSSTWTPTVRTGNGALGIGVHRRW